MTVTAKSSRKVISGSGWVNPLTHDIKIENANHIEVWADDEQLVLGVDYLVSDVLVDAGYEVTIVNPGDWAPVAWVLEHLPPITQDADLSLGGQFGRAHEASLDAIIRRMQSLEDRVDRSAKMVNTDIGPAPLITEIGDDGQTLFFDANGDIAPGANQAEISAAHQNAVDALSARVLAEAAAAAALSAVPNAFPADIAAAQALNPNTITSIFLKQERRAGQFFAVDYDDFSTLIDADTQQGIFIRSVTDPTRAYMRSVTGTEWWMEWFGAVSVALGGTDQAPAFNGMMAVANIARPSKVRIGAGFFPCHSRITTPTFQFDLEGVISGGQQTILYKEDYVEAVAGRGLISAATHGIQLRNIIFSGGSGSGGSLVSVIPPGPSGMTGDTRIANCNMTAGNFVDVSLYIDGQANVSAGPGVRDMRITDTTVFGALTASLYAVSVRALWVIGCNLLTSGGSGSQALIIGGSAGVFSDIVNVTGGSISGQISLDKADEVLIDIPSINSNISTTADVTNSTIRAGVHVSGTLDHDWTNGSRYDIGAAYRDRVAAYLSASVNDVTGAGGSGGGSPHTIKFDTFSQHVKNWEGSQNYNTSNGRYTARYAGDHQFVIGLGLLGLTSVHNRYTLKAEQYNSSGVQIHAGTRQQRGAAFADADTVGQTTLLMSVTINMSAGDYVIFTLDIEQVGAAGSAVVDLRGGGAPDRWSWFEARLAA